MSKNTIVGKDSLLVEEEKTQKFTASSAPIKLNNAELIALWESTPPISSKNSNIFRLDPAEALIKLSDYEKKTPYGWVIQPIDLEHAPMVPDINFLIAIHWMNAESRLKTSKKNDKSFTAVITRVADPLSDENMRKDRTIQNKSIVKQSTSLIWSKKERKGFKGSK